MIYMIYQMFSKLVDRNSAAGTRTVVPSVSYIFKNQWKCGDQCELIVNVELKRPVGPAVIWVTSH